MTYFVVTDDGDSMRCEAEAPQAAADAAIAEWGLEAEPGFGFHVFDAADAKKFKFALHTVAVDA